MSEQVERNIDEIMEDLQRINLEFREKIRIGFRNPDSFIKLSEIEKMGKDLSFHTQKLYLEETKTLLNEIDEDMLLRKKKPEYQAKGINLTPSQLESRAITTLNGVVIIVRRRLRPVNKESKELLLKEEGVKSIAPLDCYLGIDKLPFKMTAAVMLECAYWAQNQISFQRAEDKL